MRGAAEHEAGSDAKATVNVFSHGDFYSRRFLKSCGMRPISPPLWRQALRKRYASLGLIMLPWLIRTQTRLSAAAVRGHWQRSTRAHALRLAPEGPSTSLDCSRRPEGQSTASACMLIVKVVVW